MTAKTDAVDDLKYLTKDLLKSETLRSFCMVGDWGVGKTYAWKKIVRELRASSAAYGIRHYAYVSLFGLSTAEQVSAAIIQESERFRLQHHQWYWKVLTWLRFFPDIAGKLAILLVSIIWKLPLLLGKRSPQYFLALAKYDSVLNAFKAVGNELLPWMPEKALICFDDLERRNKSLAIDQLLGLVSHLQENAQCKIVFIFNENELNENKEDADQFHKNYEKVFDATFKFLPDLAERIDIGVPNEGSNSAEIKKYAKKLEIQNIRILTRIVWLCDEVARALGTVPPLIKQRAIEIIVLLEWARCTGDGFRAQWVEQYILGDMPRDGFRRAHKSLELEGEGGEWIDLVTLYGFEGSYGFDRTVVEGVKNGFFRKEYLKKKFIELLGLRSDVEKRTQYKNAWAPFHDVLDADNEEEVVSSLAAGFEKNISALDIHDLDQLVRVFDSLDREKLAHEFIQKFKVQQIENSLNWEDILSSVAPNRPLHRWMIASEKQELSDSPSRIFSETLNRVLSLQKWKIGDMEFLAESNDEEFVKFVKKNHRNGNHGLIAAFLDNVVGKGQSLKVVRGKVKGAMEKIALESPINRVRIKNFYGIDLSPPNPAP